MEELISFDSEPESRNLSKESVIQAQSDQGSSSPRSKLVADDVENESDLSQSDPNLRKNLLHTCTGWKHRNKEELMSMPIVEVQRLRVALSRVVEEVSSELVRLLQERHTLQEEVDYRNIAIEQLWKVQEKLQWRFTEPQLGIQMGVIFPSEDKETIDCN